MPATDRPALHPVGATSLARLVRVKIPLVRNALRSRYCRICGWFRKNRALKRSVVEFLPLHFDKVDVGPLVLRFLENVDLQSKHLVQMEGKIG